MRIPAVLTAVVVFAAAEGGRAEEVAVGASEAEVAASLGNPRGKVEAADRQVWYYDRGAIELKDGRVTRATLRSPEEQAEAQAAEERQRLAREARRSELAAEGTALRERKLADAVFATAPLAYQIAFWEDFARRYPMVSVAEPLSVARLRYNVEAAEQRRQADEDARLAALEERLERAEQAQTVYPLFTGSPYRRRYWHYDHTPGLGPIHYDFNGPTLPPYSTPSGNPAGELRGPLITTPSQFNPVLPTPSLPDPRDALERVRRMERTHDRMHQRQLRGL